MTHAKKHSPGSLLFDGRDISESDRILVVEDDLDTQANLRDILELDGYSVQAVTSIAEVYQQPDLARFFTILLDRRLPDGTVDAILPHIRRSAPDSAIIVMTGYADLDGAVAALRHRAADYILKPVNADVLRASVARIAERKRAEEALRREQEFAESLIQTARSIVLVLDTDGRVVHFNPFMEELSGYRLDDVQGQDWFIRFLPEEERRHARNTFRPLFEGAAQTGSGIYPILTRDGHYRQVSWRCKVLNDAKGRVSGVLSTGQDITDLLEAQERAIQSERLAAIGQTLSVLSHESRNELYALKLGLGLLEQMMDGQPQAVEMVGHLHDCQMRLTQLFEDVRGYGGPMVLKRTMSSLSDVWLSAWTALESSRENRIAELTEDAHRAVLDCRIDAFRLEQVFRNLFENSLAACSDPVQIHVTCSDTQLDGQSALRIAVRDNGPGLTAEQKERVFQPFFTTRQKGTGLGMAIVSRIIDAHGGRIAVGEEASSGAEFIITLPKSVETQSLPHDTVPSGPPMDEHQAPREFSARRVLVVDDMATNAHLLRSLLESYGQSEVRLAFDGRSALEQAKSFRPQIVFLDICLPDMDGRDVARLLREESCLANTLIIALSGDDEGAVTESAFDDYFVKPLSVEMVRSALCHIKLASSH